MYNIISVTVAWAVFVLGFEFYSYSLRQIVGEEPEKISGQLFNQALLHLVGFIVLLCVSPLFIYFEFIPAQYIFYFLAITLFDQLSQECYRICLALNRSQFANFLYLIKSGLWVYPLLILTLLDVPIEIELILQFWLGSTMISLLMGLYKFRQLHVLSWAAPDIKWIRQGIRTAFPFFIISIAQLTIDFSDRYLIDFFLGKREIGIYSFFYGIANVPVTLVTNVIVAQYYSKIINNYKFETSREIRVKTNTSFLYQNLGLTFTIIIGSIVLIEPLLNFVNKADLTSNLSIFYLMLLQAVIFALQIVVQTVLYAQHHDRFLLVTSLLGAVLNILLNLFLIPRFGILGATISTLVAMASILISRFLLFIKHAKTSI